MVSFRVCERCAACVVLTCGVRQVSVPVDPAPYAAVGADPGSRPWLLAMALEGGGDGRAQTEEKAEERARERAAAGTASRASAEDRFHLRARRKDGGYDATTGLVSREEEPVGEDEELPEDRFHRDDALSSHYISQREGDRTDKWAKHEREKAEREQRKLDGKASGIDENIEYIDVEDFQPGGRWGQ